MNITNFFVYVKDFFHSNLDALSEYITILQESFISNFPGIIERLADSLPIGFIIFILMMIFVIIPTLLLHNALEEPTDNTENLQ